MKLLTMQPSPTSRRILNPRAQRHLAAVQLAAAVILGAVIVLIVLALAVAAALALVAAAVAAMIFMAVNPNGNLLLLILLTHLWLLYARPEPKATPGPRGGLTIKPQRAEAMAPGKSFAA